MGAEGSATDRLRIGLLVWADTLGYALGVTVCVVVAAVVAGIATGGGLVRAKVVVFLAGFVLMGYATIRLWPSSPEDVGGATDGAGRSIPASDRTRFQSVVRALPPLRWLPEPPPTRRHAPASKLFVSSVLVLFVSYSMEAAFGIA